MTLPQVYESVDKTEYRDRKAKNMLFDVSGERRQDIRVKYILASAGVARIPVQSCSPFSAAAQLERSQQVAP